MTWPWPVHPGVGHLLPSGKFACHNKQREWKEKQIIICIIVLISFGIMCGIILITNTNNR